MPLVTECPKCKQGEVNHGFSMFPFGMRAWHRIAGGNGCCEWYELTLVKGNEVTGKLSGEKPRQIFCTCEEAVNAIHKTFPGRFHRNWVAYMLGKPHRRCPACRSLLDDEKWCDQCEKHFAAAVRRNHR